MTHPAPDLTDIQHIKLCYSKDRYCGHPRQCGIYNFGNGEIAVMHHHAQAAYQSYEDITHGWDAVGYKSRCQILLQRSLDHGTTWPCENEVVVWNYNRPLDEHRQLLWRTVDPEVARERIDLSSPDAAIYFGRPKIGRENEAGDPTMECYAWRSGDRGRTWEQVPTRVRPPAGYNYVHVDGDPLAEFPDGTVLAPATADNRNSAHSGLLNSIVAVYGSDDNGVTWNYLAEAARDPARGRLVYANLLLLPSGRLQCYMLNSNGTSNGLQMNYSDDSGYSWSAPRPLMAWGLSPWVAHRDRHPGAAATPLDQRFASKDASGQRGVRYRSLWPLRLRDGRIVVVFDRRKHPGGIGLMVSEDEGASWSAEAVIRADASDWDLGYSVATELDDGRIFVAYYFMEDDGNRFGGTRHMAGSFFRLE